MSAFLVIVSIILIIIGCTVVKAIVDLEKKLDDIISLLQPLHNVAKRRDKDETRAEWMRLDNQDMNR